MFASLSNNQRGILAICGCMAAYTVNDVLVKQILRTYPAGEVIFVRGAMSALLIGAVAAAMIATWIIPAGTYQVIVQTPVVFANVGIYRLTGSPIPSLPSSTSIMHATEVIGFVIEKIR